MLSWFDFAECYALGAVITLVAFGGAVLLDENKNFAPSKYALVVLLGMAAAWPMLYVLFGVACFLDWYCPRHRLPEPAPDKRVPIVAELAEENPYAAPQSSAP